MTETQKKFIELEKHKVAWKKFVDDLTTATKAVVDEIGIDKYFQDEDGVVYKTVVPKGKFIYFDSFTIERTKRLGEIKGSLSVKEAEEHGFKVK